MVIYISMSKSAGAMFRGSKISVESVAAASWRRPDYRARRFALFSVLLRTPGIFETCIREKKNELPVFLSKAVPFYFKIVSSHQSPNKAPEPTATSVTLRATDSF